MQKDLFQNSSLLDCTTLPSLVLSDAWAVQELGLFWVIVGKGREVGSAVGSVLGEEGDGGLVHASELLVDDGRLVDGVDDDLAILQRICWRLSRVEDNDAVLHWLGKRDYRQSKNE